jgi:hypothetical protein
MRLFDKNLQNGTDAISITVDDGFPQFLVIVYKYKKPNPSHDKPEIRAYNFADKETALQFADADVGNATFDGFVVMS